MIPISTALPGVGLIAGQITKEIKNKTEFGPAADIEVLLLDEDNTVLEYIVTDANGIFEFDELAFGTYKVMVEVMGKYSTPVEITLDEDNPAVEDLNFIITGDNITLSIDENLPVFISEIGNIYPNPVVNEDKIQYNLNEPVSVQVTVINIMGQILINYTI